MDISRTEFDRTAIPLEYTRQQSRLQEMFIEQRDVITRVLSEMTNITRTTIDTIPQGIRQLNNLINPNQPAPDQPQTKSFTPQRTPTPVIIRTEGLIVEEIVKQFFN